MFETALDRKRINLVFIFPCVSYYIIVVYIIFNAKYGNNFRWRVFHEVVRQVSPLEAPFNR